MEIKLERDGKLEEIKYLMIYVGENRYRFQETVEGKLRINKVSNGDSDTIIINPVVGNEIDLS